MDEQQISAMQQQLDELQPNLQNAENENRQAQHTLFETEGQAAVAQQRWDQFLAVAADNEREIEAQASRLKQADWYTGS